MRRAAPVPLLLLAVPAAAHPPVAPEGLWRAWSWDPAAALLLFAAAWLYARGVERTWRRAGPGRGVRRREAGAFAAGWILLALSLLSPLHALGEALFSAHMAQHALLVGLVPPLLAIGRPLAGVTAGLPARLRGAGARLARGARGLARPGAAFLLHLATVWAWHLPALYQASLRSPAAHALQHAAFLGTAVLLWHAVLHRRAGYGVGVLCLFATALHTSLLGVLLAFSPVPWYPAYSASAAAWGTTALADQQLAGLIMWMPAGLAYLAAALWLLVRWLAESERRAARWAAPA